MVAGALREEAGAVFDCAHFRVIGTEIDAADAGVGDGTGAHGAGFEGDVEIAVGEAFRAKLCGGLAEHQNFGVGCGVFQFKGVVSSAGEDFA